MSGLVGRDLGHYQLLEQIGQGGMASVYKAQDLANGRTVAVKVLTPQLALEPNFKTRFEREAQVLRGLEHPSIVPILDYGEADGIAYIVMPFMKVGGLNDRLMDGPLEVQEGARIIDQISSALQYAHDAGVVHRDVKPNNILIDEEGNAWLSDFGFAHVHDATMSLTGSALIGTPAYMAPEQVQGAPVSPLSDQYALGVILYQISTGCLPYNADTPMAIAIKHATEPLPRPREVNPNLPDSVEAVLIKALDKDPSNRFKTVRELNQSFQAALLEAIDPLTGKLKPEAVSRVLPSAPVKSSLAEADEDRKTREERKAWYARRSALALLLLLLLACPLTIRGVSPLMLGLASSEDHFAPASMPSATFDLVATVNALSTANAPKVGTEVAPGYVKTLVAATLTAMASDTQVNEDTVSATDIVMRSETTPSGTPTNDQVMAATWTNSPTSTTGVGVTSTKTNTPPVPASLIPTSTRTSTPLPFVSSTSTGTPTKTVTSTQATSATLTHTFTPESVIMSTSTPSPTVDNCAGITLAGFSTSDEKVKWQLSNSTSSTIIIKVVWIRWPYTNKKLREIKLAGNEIWGGKESPPEVTISTWKVDAENLRLFKMTSSPLEFKFEEDAAFNGYELTVTFDNGCTTSATE
jgi:serine/threonine protein kinase